MKNIGILLGVFFLSFSINGRCEMDKIHRHLVGDNGKHNRDYDRENHDHHDDDQQHHNDDEDHQNDDRHHDNDDGYHNDEYDTHWYDKW